MCHYCIEEIKDKHPYFKKKQILLHRDNAWTRLGAISINKIIELKFEVLQHPMYSTDLVPSDFSIFKLNKWFSGQQFTTNEEVITTTDAYFEDFPKSYFSGGLIKL